MFIVLLDRHIGMYGNAVTADYANAINTERGNRNIGAAQKINLATKVYTPGVTASISSHPCANNTMTILFNTLCSIARLTDYEQYRYTICNSPSCQVWDGLPAAENSNPAGICPGTTIFFDTHSVACGAAAAPPPDILLATAEIAHIGQRIRHLSYMGAIL